MNENKVRITSAQILDALLVTFREFVTTKRALNTAIFALIAASSNKEFLFSAAFSFAFAITCLMVFFPIREFLRDGDAKELFGGILVSLMALVCSLSIYAIAGLEFGAPRLFLIALAAIILGLTDKSDSK